jgi:hypothetical protein
MLLFHTYLLHPYYTGSHDKFEVSYAFIPVYDVARGRVGLGPGPGPGSCS